MNTDEIKALRELHDIARDPLRTADEQALATAEIDACLDSGGLGKLLTAAEECGRLRAELRTEGERVALRLATQIREATARADAAERRAEELLERIAAANGTARDRIAALEAALGEALDEVIRQSGDNAKRLRLHRVLRGDRA